MNARQAWRLECAADHTAKRVTELLALPDAENLEIVRASRFKAVERNLAELNAAFAEIKKQHLEDAA